MDRLGHLGIGGCSAHANLFRHKWIAASACAPSKQRGARCCEEDKKVLEKHPAPRIEPVVPRVKEGKRAAAGERQAPLFVTPGSKELPPLSLLDPAEKSKAQQFSQAVA